MTTKMKNKKKSPAISTAPVHVPSLERIIAAGDPAVHAVTRNMPASQQKSVWNRYVQIVLRNRNYDRNGHVASEYIKTKER